MADQAKARRPVGYVLRKFPVLSETFILNELLALEAQGVPLHVFSLAPPRDPRYHEGIARLKAPITYVPGPLELRTLLRHNWRLCRRHRKRYLRQLLRVLLTFRPSLLWRFLQAGHVADRARRFKVRHLHAHFANRTTTVAFQASRILKIPYSFTAHAFDIHRDANRRVLSRKMRHARFVVTVSRWNVDFLRGLLGDRPARIELVHNGIDLSRFHQTPRPTEGPFTILAVARFVEKKGLPYLVEACHLLRRRGIDFRCNLVGKGMLRGTLEAAIRRHGLQDRVHLLGPHTQDEIVDRYREASVLALPCIVGEDGNRDGLPVSIVEALACGLPVVSTPVTGIPEVVVPGVNGLLVEEKDPVGLADALESLARDRELLEELASNARRSVEATFDQDTTAARLRELFMEDA